MIENSKDGKDNSQDAVKAPTKPRQIQRKPQQVRSLRVSRGVLACVSCHVVSCRVVSCGGHAVRDVSYRVALCCVSPCRVENLSVAR